MTNVAYLDLKRIRARGDEPMNAEEKLDEVQWLLDGGTSPELAAKQLGMLPKSFAQLARRHGRHDLAVTLERDQTKSTLNPWGGTKATAFGRAA